MPFNTWQLSLILQFFFQFIFFFPSLCDSRLTPSLSISEKREMKGIGVGQRPGGVAGIIINLHDQNSAVYAVSLEMCMK